ncbi:MAG TPA: hypothetical protein VJV78_24815 [Polyangiales bacterium]|nr:hypothetical protein [Polyangiales bacterium]
MQLIVFYGLPGMAATLATWWFGCNRGWSRVQRGFGIALAFGVFCSPALAASKHGALLTSALAMLIADPTSSRAYAMIGITAVFAFLAYLMLSATYGFVIARLRPQESQ